jgi:hypothetical protein
VKDFDGPCGASSTCCEAGSVCSALEGGSGVCKPLQAPQCLQPLAFNTRSNALRLASPATSICLFGGFCRVSSDCVMGTIDLTLLDRYPLALTLPCSHSPSCVQFS